MSSKLQFMVGPPGTGKTSTFITRKYTELLKKFNYKKIIILSHTNVAADEIKDEILKLEKIKEKGLTKKSFKYKICTIHSYCKSKNLNKELFDYKEAENTLQDWIDRGGAKKLFGLNASAHLALAWLTAKRGDCGRSQHWLSHLKNSEQASGENIQIYCDALILRDTSP